MTVVKSQVIDTADKSDLALMKNCRPLHRRAMQLLAHGAVADFRVHRIGTRLISNRSTVATRFVSGLDLRIVGARKQSFEFIHLFVPTVIPDPMSLLTLLSIEECTMIKHPATFPALPPAGDDWQWVGAAAGKDSRVGWAQRILVRGRRQCRHRR